MTTEIRNKHLFNMRKTWAQKLEDKEAFPKVLKLEKNHGVKGSCSLTTGIFIMTIVNAAEEAVARGEKSALAKIPYWRTLKADGFLNHKYPGGLEGHKKRLEREGHRIIARGKKFQVANY